MRIVIWHEFGSKSQLVSQVIQKKIKQTKKHGQQLLQSFGIVAAMKLGQQMFRID